MEEASDAAMEALLELDALGWLTGGSCADDAEAAMPLPLPFWAGEQAGAGAGGGAVGQEGASSGSGSVSTLGERGRAQVPSPLPPLSVGLRFLDPDCAAGCARCARAKGGAKLLAAAGACWPPSLALTPPLCLALAAARLRHPCPTKASTSWWATRARCERAAERRTSGISSELIARCGAASACGRPPSLPSPH
jgi:hypothetical protein